mgnify:CR=1 FL=1
MIPVKELYSNLIYMLVNIGDEMTIQLIPLREESFDDEENCNYQQSFSEQSDFTQKHT